MQATKNNVIFLPIVEEAHSSGLIIKSPENTKTFKGKAVSIGPTVEADIEVGDVCFYSKGTVIRVESNDYVFVKDTDLLAVLS